MSSQDSFNNYPGAVELPILKDPLFNSPFHYSPIDPAIEQRLTALDVKVDSIINKLNLIFGDTVLLNGKFVSVGNQFETKKG